MSVIKNANGKTVCRADSAKKIIEIIQKGFKTVIQFTDDGTMTVVNTVQV